MWEGENNQRLPKMSKALDLNRTAAALPGIPNEGGGVKKMMALSKLGYLLTLITKNLLVPMKDLKI